MGIIHTTANLKNKLWHWIALLLFEGAVFWIIDAIKPQCEPCLPGQICDPCVSSEQVILTWTGMLLAVVFIIWQLILYRRQYKN